MANFTMCSGVRCYKARACYLATAKRSENQPMFLTPPVNAQGDCDMFWYNGEVAIPSKPVDSAPEATWVKFAKSVLKGE